MTPDSATATEAATAPDNNAAPETAADQAEIFSVTPEALAKVLEVRDAEDDAETLGLRVEVTGIEGIEYGYALSIDPVPDAADDDAVYQVGALTVIVPANSIEQLTGASLDLPSNPAQGGLVIRNPNRPNPLQGTDIELSGTLEEQLQQLLDLQINPALSAHGGSAELLKVDGSTAHILMGGGCQGCAMSAATLREGISVMIAQALPEITEIIDATDHTEGENPYFE